LGAATDVNSDLQWLTPLPLWAGILAGPVAWAFDLTTSYALVKWVCASDSYGVLHAITVVAFAIVCAGAALSWLALRQTAGDLPTDGGQPRQRARFMALLGLTSSALFAMQILAGAVPNWVLDACQ
jgi:hypothetical protein